MYSSLHSTAFRHIVFTEVKYQIKVLHEQRHFRICPLSKSVIFASSTVHLSFSHLRSVLKIGIITMVAKKVSFCFFVC